MPYPFRKHTGDRKEEPVHVVYTLNVRDVYDEEEGLFEATIYSDDTVHVVSKENPSRRYKYDTLEEYERVWEEAFD